MFDQTEWNVTTNNICDVLSSENDPLASLLRISRSLERMAANRQALLEAAEMQRAAGIYHLLSVYTNNSRT